MDTSHIKYLARWKFARSSDWVVVPAGAANVVAVVLIVTVSVIVGVAMVVVAVLVIRVAAVVVVILSMVAFVVVVKDVGRGGGR